MQTFLPYEDFEECARVLDRARLGKQRIECKQINIALRGGYAKAWVNHPAVLMWKGYELAHCEYAMAICREWRNRGYADAQLGYFHDELMYWEKWKIVDSFFPHWLGDDAVHASHRSNLLRKNYDHYSRFGWREKSDLPYVWPKGHRAYDNLQA